MCIGEKGDEYIYFVVYNFHLFAVHIRLYAPFINIMALGIGGGTLLCQMKNWLLHPDSD